MSTPLVFQRVMPNGVGLAPVYVSADAAGNTFPVHLCAVLHIKNAGGSPITATVHADGSYATPAPDSVVSVPAGGEVLVGPMPMDPYNALATTGRVITAAGEYAPPGLVTFSGITGVTLAALCLGVAVNGPGDLSFYL